MNSSIFSPLTLFGLLAVTSSTNSTVDWKVAVDYLRDCREIIVCNAFDASDVLSAINEYGLLPTLVYTRSSRDARTSLHRSRGRVQECTSAIGSEPSGYACPASNASDALAIVDDLGRHSPRAKIVVRVDRSVADPASILRYAWDNYNVTNAIVVRGGAGPTLITTYDPFAIAQDGTRGVARAIDVGKENRTHAVLAAVESTLRDRFADMHGYPLTVTIFEVMIMYEGVVDANGTVVDHIGLDASLHEVLVERMRYRPHVVTPRVGSEYGQRDADGRFWGSIGDIEYKYATLAANIRFMKDYGTGNAAFTTPVKQTRLCYVVPKYQPPMSVIPLIPPMDGSTGIVIVVALVCSSAVWRLIGVCYDRLGRPSADARDVLERSFKLLISASVRKPRTNPERCLYLVLSYLSLILLHVYEGLVVTEITSPGRSVDIRTLRQLQASGLKIGIARSLNEPTDFNFTDDVETTYDRLRKTEITFERTDDIMSEETFNRRSAVLIPEVMVDYMVNTLASDKDGSDLVHKVEECPLTYYSAYTVSKHSPYVDRINEIIARLHDCGIISKWTENITFTVKMARVRRAKRYGSSHLVIFSVFYYWKAFLLYGACIVASTLVFIVEITWPKLGR